MLNSCFVLSPRQGLADQATLFIENLREIRRQFLRPNAKVTGIPGEGFPRQSEKAPRYLLPGR